ncbi:glutamate/aspartate ABC transporter periplasmic glutamate/aspartate-binding protein GltI [Pseudomonas sp. FH4]|jgi:glutamate/aspartate transport system substrate-binding protein|uniref:Glutamate/aspartate ABC transporter substrate-binding protein n=2 Tax=Pseudomonas TaxID=286 RepID=A0A176V6L5_9PSED|nr:MULTISPECIES: glutamate/aspartate ABC transporter substrate-binding protein [Pseudomonas]AYG09584.1 glutamate/aspartate ABC transporter substrate-binding protein [Pseudomonas fluorescens]KAA6171777.1 glutamate/aspartate ABC transporter substrate-binding protein [Pseudomonas marginalis]MBU0938931.1 glutamate/aspartate ABC transporter substrate-binding protein [Gammaproteobacteria bacterium]ETK18409.1 glutamate/aspartate ABC transporter periplasmic glutamate/aspartate-binding protein GltI [Pse|eukprot:gene9184-8995_t
MRIVPHILGAAIAAALISTPVFAAELTGTLKKIKESGTITLGHRDASIPFSYIADGSGKPVGYSHDIQLAIVKAVEKDLGMKEGELKVKYNLVTSQTRIPLVQNGTVDVECGSTTNNVERQQQVDFSVGIFEIGTRLLSKKDSTYKDFADLKGKNVVTTAGTTSERILKSMNADKQMGMNVISAKDHGESFQMLESGRAVAFMMDDALLAGEMAKAKKPTDWAVTGTPQSFEIYGCMVRKGDAPFKKAVDDAIVATYKSGEINNIYTKWFSSPIPPKGLNLMFPMSDELKALIANPTDKAADDKTAEKKS